MKAAGDLLLVCAFVVLAACLVRGGGLIFAVENYSEFVLVDASSGKVLERIPTPLQFSMGVIAGGTNGNCGSFLALFTARDNSISQLVTLTVPDLSIASIVNMSYMPEPYSGPYGLTLVGGAFYGVLLNYDKHDDSLCISRTDALNGSTACLLPFSLPRGAAAVDIVISQRDGHGYLVYLDSTQRAWAQEIFVLAPARLGALRRYSCPVQLSRKDPFLRVVSSGLFEGGDGTTDVLVTVSANPPGRYNLLFQSYFPGQETCVISWNMTESRESEVVAMAVDGQSKAIYGLLVSPKPDSYQAWSASQFGERSGPVKRWSAPILGSKPVASLYDDAIFISCS